MVVVVVVVRMVLVRVLVAVVGVMGLLVVAGQPRRGRGLGDHPPSPAAARRPAAAPRRRAGEPVKKRVVGRGEVRVPAVVRGRGGAVVVGAAHAQEPRAAPCEPPPTPTLLLPTPSPLPRRRAPTIEYTGPEAVCCGGGILPFQRGSVFAWG